MSDAAKVARASIGFMAWERDMEASAAGVPCVPPAKAVEDLVASLTDEQAIVLWEFVRSTIDATAAAVEAMSRNDFLG